MAKQCKSRADNTRVKDAINLIKSVPTIRHSPIKNPTRTLRPEQYARVLEFIESEIDTYDLRKLRYEYTLGTEQFEIRMTNDLHNGVACLFRESYACWHAELEKSNDAVISSAAKTTRGYGNGRVRLPFTEQITNTKSPDGGIRHICRLKCPKLTLVLEVGWSEDREHLKDKAEQYILGSQGKIRTVVVVNLREIYEAELRNENKLRRLYRNGSVDTNSPYSYAEDENNETGGASFLVWRAQIKDGTVTVGRVDEQRFRDTTGDAIQHPGLVDERMRKMSITDLIGRFMSEDRRKPPRLPRGPRGTSEGLYRSSERETEIRGERDGGTTR
ncbi:hypothetical protein O1611_g2715 [Lasiodiplodia mahajangana]|uniref:Uncharacterized protein n=1 Tax=Lasiodiplodia mahajangana TaxID=1108764 RepID=A0ACC2JTR0_9PEZI|nr:hypothetical protein O1611_g2715 [Lasiodiplodia mahajangana]